MPTTLGVTPILSALLGFPRICSPTDSRVSRSIFIDGVFFRRVYQHRGDPYGNYVQGQDTGQLSAALNKIHGKHDMKFGFEGRMHQIELHSDQCPERHL